MPRSEKVDAYIENAAPFAQPILRRLRDVIHKAEPRIEETIKWGVPHFDYKGPVAGVAAFKAHIRFGFWKSKLMKDPAGILNAEAGGMAVMRLEGERDLPPQKVLLEYVKEAVALNEAGIKASKPAPRKKPPPKTPDVLMAALRQNKAALKVFEAFSPSRKREYIEWITDAKQEATREKRLKQAIEWIAEGKPRNWKYM